MSSPAPSIQFAWDGPGALGPGDNAKFLRWNDAAGRFEMATAGGSSHNLLSATHPDVTSGAVARGDVITGQGASPTWTRKTLGASGTFLRSDGTDLLYSTIQASDLSARSLADLGTRALANLSDWPAPTAGYYLRRNAGDTAYEWAAVSGGVTDHGALTGLGDDDHAQYLVLAPAAGSRNRLVAPTDGGSVLQFGVSGLTSTYATINVSDAAGAAAVTIAIGGGTDYILKRPGYAEWVTGYVVNFSTQGYYTQFHQRCYFFSLYSDVPQITVRGSAGQTSSLTEWQDSTTAIQFAIGATGKILTNQASTNTNTPSGATAKALPIYDAAGTLLGYAPLYAAPW